MHVRDSVLLYVNSQREDGLAKKYDVITEGAPNAQTNITKYLKCFMCLEYDHQKCKTSTYFSKGSYKFEN